MDVRHVMTQSVITIPEGSTYKEAASILHTNNISGAPVIDDTENLIGVLSEKDLFRVLYPFYSSYYETPEMYTDFEKREEKIKEIKEKSIERFVSRKPITAHPDTPVMKAGGILLAKGIHRMPVVEDNKLVGIVTRRDIYTRILVEHL